MPAPDDRPAGPGRPAPGIDVAAMRAAYSDTGLTEADLAAGWVAQFGRWLADAVAAELVEPNAMVLATADADGVPSARTVLLKGYDEDGFVFYTNYDSRKGVQLTVNPQASLVLGWIPLHRQVLVGGSVRRVARAESEQYFASRPRGSQLGAWASPQSQVIADRVTLEAERAALDARYPEEVPTPPHWGGFRVRPAYVEFWQGRTDRLHDRLRYRRAGADWVVERLAP